MSVMSGQAKTSLRMSPKMSMLGAWIGSVRAGQLVERFLKGGTMLTPVWWRYEFQRRHGDRIETETPACRDYQDDGRANHRCRTAQQKP